MIGDHPPPACWRADSGGLPYEVALAGPLYRGEGLDTPGSSAVVHLAEGPSDIQVQIWMRNPGLPLPWGGFTPPSFELVGPDLAFTSTWSSFFGLYGAGLSQVSDVDVQVTEPVPEADIGVPALYYGPDEDTLAVAAVNVYPGAWVELEATAGGVTQLLDRRWAGERTRVALAVPAPLAIGTSLTVRQWAPVIPTGGGSATWISRVSAPAAVVAGRPNMSQPAVPFEVEEGAVAIPVVGVTPGSLVEILAVPGGAGVGSARFGETSGHVPVCLSGPQLQVRVTRAGVSVTTGTITVSGATTRKFRRYEHDATPQALVFLMHGAPAGTCDTSGAGEADCLAGYGTWSGTTCFAPGGPSDDSFLGYDYLRDSLAALDLDVVSFTVTEKALDLPDRAAYYERFVADYCTFPPHQTACEAPWIFLGHSLGGEAAIRAAALHAASHAVLGACALAPSSKLDDAPPALTFPIQVLYGTHDGSFGASANNNLAPGRWRDVSPRFALGELPGGDHAQFNACWPPQAPELTRAEQEAWTQIMVQRFIEDAITGAPDHSLYSHARDSNQPRGAWRRRGSFLTRTELWWMLDDFEDADPTHNAQQRTVSGGGALTFSEATLWSLVSSQVRPMTAAANRAARLTWTGPGTYVTRFPTNHPTFLPDDTLTVDVTLASSSTSAPNVPVDLTARLFDREGRTAAVALGALHELATAGPRLETVEVPLRSFLAVEPLLALDDLSRLRLETDLTPTGALVLDNLALRRIAP
ncbi:MAG TPA: hypothetical protein PKA64_02170 [Myxococcota bacterium]|nr:hypothetical protein [Myxococcota bacterium]